MTRLDTYQYELRTHKRYGAAMYGFWAIVIFGGMLSNLYNVFWHARKDRQRQSHVEGETVTKPNSVLSKAWRQVQEHAILPPVFGDHHRRTIFGFFVPTRLESFIIFAYWTISLVLCSVTYITFEGNMYWPTIPPQVWRYIADRTGIVAYANLPILWLFSGRNNIFLWATGWDFGTFNLFHRHVARVATIEAIVHSAAWTVLAMPSKYIRVYHDIVLMFDLRRTIRLVPAFTMVLHGHRRHGDHGADAGPILSLDTPTILRALPAHSHCLFGHHDSQLVLPHIGLR